MTRRIIAFILVLATFISLVPVGGVIAVSTDADNGTQENYGAVIGNTAQFNISAAVNFLIFSDPAVFDYDTDWNNDENWIYCYGDGENDDIAADHLFTIENYYYDAETTALWYKVNAAPGYELPEKMQNSRWVFQNYTEEYEYEGWEEYAPDALIITGAQNFVFDKDGNPVTEVEIGLYDKFELTCKTSLLGSPEYQWQIRVGDEWVEIMGADSATIPADYSLLANAIDESNRAQLRCVTKSGSKTVEGEPITVISRRRGGCVVSIKDGRYHIDNPLAEAIVV